MTVTATQVQPQQMFIGGKWTDARDGALFERHSPFDGSLVSVHQDGDVADVEAAIEAARHAFDSGPWRQLPMRERRNVMLRAAELLRRDSDRLAAVLSAEVGQPNRGEPIMAAEYLEYYAHLAFDLRDEAVASQDPNALGIIASEPVGVVGVITAWNGPVAQTAWKVAPAMAVGCSIVTKPSHLTSTAVVELGRIFDEAGVPAGVFNVVTSARERGAIVGQVLCESPLVDAISFTGSTATGRKIMAAASGTLKRVLLELGGKSPNIVFADADLEAAAQGAFSGVTLLAGQACQSGTRLLVQQSVHDEFVERLERIFRTEPRLGNPLEPDTTIGPLVTPEQQQRVLSYIEAGREQGRIVAGGGAPTDPGLAAGSFVEPTIVCDVPVDNRMVREEIFGPVIAVIPFADDAEAIRIANDTAYGLASAIWTSNLDRALRCAKALRAGTVWVNTYRNSGLFTMPFGGYKTSGLGRELGREGLAEFLEKKSIHIKLRGSPL
jgi:acyl-CoA reductase-like NAD-dependent aldehyde dehydrogenase